MIPFKPHLIHLLFKQGNKLLAQSKKNQQKHKVLVTEVNSRLLKSDKVIQTVKLELDSPLKAKPKHSRPILLFSFNPNQQSLIVTKSGKEYLESLGLWKSFQSLINSR